MVKSYRRSAGALSRYAGLAVGGVGYAALGMVAVAVATAAVYALKGRTLPPWHVLASIFRLCFGIPFTTLAIILAVWCVVEGAWRSVNRCNREVELRSALFRSDQATRSEPSPVHPGRALWWVLISIALCVLSLNLYAFAANGTRAYQSKIVIE